jgi:hypothetical protein
MNMKRQVLHITAGNDEWTPTSDELQAIVNSFMLASLDDKGGVVATSNAVDVTTIEVDEGALVVVNGQQLGRIGEMPGTEPEEDNAVEVIQLARVNLKSFLVEQDGKFVGIDYTKIDGDHRALNGRLGVVKFLKGGANTVEALDRSYLTVYDMKAKGYRTVDLDSTTRVRANRKIYDVID